MARRLLLFIQVYAICLLPFYTFAAPGDEFTFDLEWQADGCQEARRVDLDRAEPFAKEPDFVQREVLRGTLSIGPPESKEQMGLAWDYSRGMLYVDLNRDGDLTNDPDGVLETDNKGVSSYMNQDFPVFPLTISTPKGDFRYRLSAELYKYSLTKFARITIRSGYSGTTVLHDRKWGFKVVDPLRGRILRNDNFSIIRVQDYENTLLEDIKVSNEVGDLPLPTDLFLDGRCYDLEFRFNQINDAPPQLQGTLTEKVVPLTELKIKGERIEHLVFGDGEMLIIPNLETGSEPQQVPTGRFNRQALVLRIDNRRITPQNSHLKPIVFDENEVNVFRAGCPLKSRVAIQRNGNVLQFDYKLAGIGGEEYNVRSVANGKPSIEIYKGDLLLKSGRFEYG
ncbi:MAG: hypothetical protein K9N52_03445 [Verrucomicrobia bacterium]|nr:hypothetical protein [Verrucomicrobiota bacterium]